ncbi:AAA family ATPase [Rhodococcus qingshengii]|uniref:AAA family ATPase n=1 Tax=Rhodococcus qingshengii TaxID=334542 RepID=UPI00237D043A|nr:AAA family ATPase [Rhodococcus qingshengii]WCT05935.1 AAA family ATPase [Rhodococcus qingshengii]
MRIYVTNKRFGFPDGAKFPCIVLHSDNWDDFGYKTMYNAELYATANGLSSLGSVKIMRFGMNAEEAKSTNLPIGALQLGDEYCSLGQATSYYETLSAQLSATDLRTYLQDIRDVVADDERRQRFSSEDAFDTSLLREGGARRALTDARDLLHGFQMTRDLSFQFETSVGGSTFQANFKFGDLEDIPSRINAVIGYNGVGKTSLMANLSHVAWRDTATRADIAHQYGQIIPSDIPFGRVVAISYSAFDTFEIPPQTDQYVYRGLRDVAVDSSVNRLRTSDEIADELEHSLDRLRTDDRWVSLNNALAPLLREPSFQTSAMTLDFRANRGDWRPVFDNLSTGHKISLNIVVQLVSQLENKSLVLIDEPESHLHPPLLAALMKGISEALNETNSFAIIATHSPVVLQEVATQYVQVLRRYGTQTLVERPATETFGENVGILTRTVFNLDNAESDYEGILRSLAVTHGADGLDEIFPMGISSQALAIVMEAEARFNDDLGEF